MGMTATPEIARSSLSVHSARLMVVDRFDGCLDQLNILAKVAALPIGEPLKEALTFFQLKLRCVVRGETGSGRGDVGDPSLLKEALNQLNLRGDASSPGRGDVGRASLLMGQRFEVNNPSGSCSAVLVRGCRAT